MDILKQKILLVFFLMGATLHASQHDDDHKLSLVRYISEEDDGTKKSKSLYTAERPKSPHINKLLHPVPVHAGEQYRQYDDRPSVDVITKKLTSSLITIDSNQRSAVKTELSEEQIDALKKKLV